MVERADHDRGNVVEPGADRGKVPRSRQVGDLPRRFERYFSEEQGLRRELRLFENPRDKAAAIRDRGDRLIAGNESQAVARDMIAIAAHRGWREIRVTGTDSFRRMIAFEASRQDIEIAGARRVRSTSSRDPGGRRDQQQPDLQRAPVDFRQGVRGKIVEQGNAIYGGKPGRRPSPFVDLRLADGEIRRAWGAGIPAALARAQVAPGDEILLRQEPAEAGRRVRAWTVDTERVRERGGEGASEGKGDRFRRMTPPERARDEDLRGAQSQLTAAKALAAAYLAGNPVAAALVTQRIEAGLARALDKEKHVGMARVRQRPDGRTELVARRSSRERAVAGEDAAIGRSPERPAPTKGRDRGRRR